MLEPHTNPAAIILQATNRCWDADVYKSYRLKLFWCRDVKYMDAAADADLLAWRRDALEGARTPDDAESWRVARILIEHELKRRKVKIPKPPRVDAEAHSG